MTDKIGKITESTIAPPRLLPTLTEVVPIKRHPQNIKLQNISPQISTFPTPLEEMDNENYIEQNKIINEMDTIISKEAIIEKQAQKAAEKILSDLNPPLHEIIGQAIARVLHEQMRGLNTRVQKEVSEVVKNSIINKIKNNIDNENTEGGGI